MQDGMNVLREIIEKRRSDIATARKLVSETDLLKRAQKRRHHSLADQLRASAGTRIIAEIKKASPSAGLICKTYDPAAIAREYEKAGAVGISVLTEPSRFLGSIEHLKAVREAVKLPVLRKDFICDRFQILEAAAFGADAVLLIVAALEQRTLRRLYAQAVELGLEVIVEVHTKHEIEKTLACRNAIIGVNNRDLKTLRTDVSAAKELASEIPPDRLAIVESGIASRSDIIMLQRLGYKGFLVGEFLLRDVHPGRRLAELIRRS